TPTRAANLLDLCRDIGRIPDAFRDYRVRLQESGEDIQGLRGLAAARPGEGRTATDRRGPAGETSGEHGCRC
ncbi:MAG: hypothetical protein AB1445_13635, partial [Bacillota bacterium]